MGEFYMLVGLPASGKSTYAKELVKKTNGVLLSSDELREELYGDVNNQEHNAEVFEEMRKRTILALKSGINVVYDATNISSKRRRALLSQFPKGVNKVCIYINTSHFSCLINDTLRGRIVGRKVINKMYRNLQIPMYHEGWDNIAIVTYKSEYSLNYDKIDSFDCFEDYKEFLSNHHETVNCVGLAQDNPHHTLSVDRHMYYAYDYAKTNGYNGYVLKALLLHDIGKPFCKEFNDKYAHFYGHDNVSSQLALSLMVKLGHSHDYIIKVCTLIQLHMRLLGMEVGSKGRDKLRKQIGDELFTKLVELNNADNKGR